MVGSLATLLRTAESDGTADSGQLQALRTVEEPMHHHMQMAMSGCLLCRHNGRRGRLADADVYRRRSARSVHLLADQAHPPRHRETLSSGVHFIVCSPTKGE